MTVNSMASRAKTGAAGPAGTADAALLRRAFGAFPTGVTVVTVAGLTPHGMTANSFTAVSLQPPLVLVCVDRQAIMHRRIALGLFGVSVLASDQERVARHFADLQRPLGAAQFEGIPCEPGRLTGAPLIKGAVARFECELDGTCDGGDHTIFIGRLLSLDWAPERAARDGLIFARGRFRSMALEPGEKSA